MVVLCKQRNSTPRFMAAMQQTDVFILRFGPAPELLIGFHCTPKTITVLISEVKLRLLPTLTSPQSHENTAVSLRFIFYSQVSNVSLCSLFCSKGLALLFYDLDPISFSSWLRPSLAKQMKANIGRLNRSLCWVVVSRREFRARYMHCEDRRGIWLDDDHKHINLWFHNCV